MITSGGGSTLLYLDPTRALQQIGDLQTVRSMLPMLQEMLDRDIPQIARFISDGDMSSANPLLHSLKGCMPIFCATALCDELGLLEKMSKAGGRGGAEVHEAFASLGPKLQRLQIEVADYLSAPAE